MALSIVSIPGDGVTNTFTVSFALGILDRNSTTAWVTGEVDGGGNKVYRNITYLTDTLLQISGAPPGNGIMVVFTRTVSQTSLIVNYEDGDIMNETNLNTSQKQALMLVHQVLDGRFSAFIQNVSAGGFKITNLGTPTASTDAATKAYVDSVVATGAASAAAAAASAAAALASQNAASGFSTSASASATLASQWAQNPEDVAVPGNPGKFSSLHWAAKAAAYVLGNVAGAVHSAPQKTPGNTDEGLILESVGGGFGLKKFLFSDLITFIFGSDRTLTGAFTATTSLIQGTANALGQIFLASSAIEIGQNKTADGPALVDFHAVSPNTDFDARILRNSGTNGSFSFVQTGTGGIQFTASGSADTTFTYNSRQIMHTSGGPAVGDLVVGGASSQWSRTPIGSTGQVLQVLAGVPQWVEGTVEGTQFNTITGSAAVDITGIPSWAKKITVVMFRTSFNAASETLIQAGTSGGPITTGYVGTNTQGGGALGVSALSSGFKCGNSAAGDIMHGVLVLTRLGVGANDWSGVMQCSRSDTTWQSWTTGTFSSGAAIDRIRFTTVAGTAGCDAGWIKVYWE